MRLQRRRRHGQLRLPGDTLLKKFNQATDASAEKMYLEMMTTHHEGAITMAKTQIEGDPMKRRSQTCNSA